MVITDIAGQPVHQAWEVVKSAALNGCTDVVPLVFPLLVSAFMLVLNIKEPHGYTGKKQENGEVHHYKCLVAQ